MLQAVYDLAAEAVERFRELTQAAQDAPSFVWRNSFPVESGMYAERGHEHPTSGSPGGWGGMLMYGAPIDVTEIGSPTRQYLFYVTGGSTLCYAAPAPLDEAQRLQWEHDRQQAEERYKQEVEANRLAEERSLELLAEFMSPAQRDQYFTEVEFIVVAKSGRRYKIRPRQQVAELGSGDHVIMSYCISPNARLPYGDVMLAQKLMLENNEAEFHRVANAFTVGGRRLV